jgi:hypothetical protein
VLAVGFTRMKDGTREDYQFLPKLELEHISKLANQLLQDLEQERSPAAHMRSRRGPPQHGTCHLDVLQPAFRAGIHGILGSAAIRRF